ncbi:MAG: peptidase S41, partial [Chloroflexi bacterium]|nr:peptidase S41 [Chloroflexota bacterium]
ASTLQDLIDADVPGIIVDVRANSGGIPQLAMAMAGHFFTDYERVIDFYYADGEGNFDYRGFIEILVSEPHYDGPVAVLVDPLTGSAGDVFVYAMQFDERALVVGHTPTGGFTGEVSDGQYLLPGALTVQVPTGRPANPLTGETVLEGVGVVPDVRVPLTRDSVLSPEDEVLDAAQQALLDMLGG